MNPKTLTLFKMTKVKSKMLTPLGNRMDSRSTVVKIVIWCPTVPHPWHYSKSNWGGASTTVACKKGCFGINPQRQGISGTLLLWFKSSAARPPCFTIVSAEFQTKNPTFLKNMATMTTQFQTGLTGTSQNRLLLWHPPPTASLLLYRTLTAPPPPLNPHQVLQKSKSQQWW